MSIFDVYTSEIPYLQIFFYEPQEVTSNTGRYFLLTQKKCSRHDEKTDFLFFLFSSFGENCEFFLARQKFHLFSIFTSHNFLLVFSHFQHFQVPIEKMLTNISFLAKFLKFFSAAARIKKEFNKGQKGPLKMLSNFTKKTFFVSYTINGITSIQKTKKVIENSNDHSSNIWVHFLAL